MSAVSIGSSIYLHGCRDDRFGKNCLGTITVTTSSNRDRSTTGENNLVLFKVAKRLHAIIDDDTNNRIGNLFTKGSLHRNLSVIYIVQNLFHQGKGNQSIRLNGHYFVLFKNPRDKLQIVTLAKQMYPSETAWVIKEYEGAMRRPYGYLCVDLRLTTPERCRFLPGEERFDKGFHENRISQELLQYLKQQTLVVPRQFRRCNAFKIIWIISCTYKPWRGPKSEAVHAVTKHVFKL